MKFIKKKYEFKTPFTKKYSFTKSEIKRHISLKTRLLGIAVKDYDVMILILWAGIGPLCALGYIIWKKFYHLKWFAILCFAIGVLMFLMQIPYYLSFFNFLKNLLPFSF